MVEYDPTIPKEAELTFSYERGLDIDLNYGTDATEPLWQPFRGATAIETKTTPVMKSIATYDDKGGENETKVSETTEISWQIQGRRLADTGKKLPEVEKMFATDQPDVLGEQAVVRLRYYDKPANGIGDPADAYEVIASVSGIERVSSANDDVDGWKFSCKAKGLRKKIANPFTGWVVPAEPVVTPTQ